ncbi:MAG: sodium/solute symporter [Opitutaceae bacterium]|nr:sodium/solute symporter [Opitutaceae bacterium]
MVGLGPLTLAAGEPEARPAVVHFSGLDWVVIAAYAGLMLLVGWHYSRKAKDAESFLFGDRKMKSSGIGISLFATLVSSIAYLSWPGEVIRHGPMMLANVGAYPIIMLVVGWLLIPRFMQLRVTSSYEVLELRFGLAARLLGAVFFIILRLLWMGMIVYTSVNLVLMPLLDFSPVLAPLLALLVIGVTTVYSSLGGLRAVVLTDVLQSLLMLAGLLATLWLVTQALGGVGAWWPREWSVSWDAPVFWFHADQRSMAAAILNGAVWWICTCASDQMAIQRYAATPDARSARQALAITLGADGVVSLVMLLVGFALFAYFSVHPELVAGVAEADQYFPVFISKGFPAGLGGLLIAAILSAAMSSLSSGLNSTVTVIKADFLDRFAARRASGEAQLRSMRMLSVVLALAVAAVSLAVPLVEGNLLEATNKFVGLWVGPLAVLFLLALLVPWATSFGAIAGAVASMLVSVGIAYGQLGGLGFFWILPVSAAVGVGGGMAASLLPIGPPPSALPLGR